jgi:glucose-6-phosphate 1-dehydrogenase
LKKTAMATRGWTRLVIEKPFGHDLESCQALTQQLGKEFEEHQLYRIDHYLGKEVVQNLFTLRFSNTWLEYMWNRNAVSAVHIVFKEPFGTMGRGGYFDASGIIRDILQNHLLQVLTLVAMEPPTSMQGNDIRDKKVEVLEAMSTLTIDDCLLGQYEGYTDDDTIQNKDTNTPTYAAIQCRVNTRRWEGVPFILEAGKSLDERVCQVRIQFHPVPGLPRNELVMRLQPDPAIYMRYVLLLNGKREYKALVSHVFQYCRTNVKTPGFATSPTQVSLGMEYNTEFDSQHNNPGAYTRLLLDVMRGRQGSFVRSDELEKSWAIFTPLLHKIEREDIRPHLYKQGSAGPAERTDFMKRMGVSEGGFHEGSYVPQSFL